MGKLGETTSCLSRLGDAARVGPKVKSTLKGVTLCRVHGHAERAVSGGWQRTRASMLIRGTAHSPETWTLCRASPTPCSRPDRAVCTTRLISKELGTGPLWWKTASRSDYSPLVKPSFHGELVHTWMSMTKA